MSYDLGTLTSILWLLLYTTVRKKEFLFFEGENKDYSLNSTNPHVSMGSSPKRRNLISRKMSHRAWKALEASKNFRGSSNHTGSRSSRSSNTDLLLLQVCCHRVRSCLIEIIIDRSPLPNLIQGNWDVRYLNTLASS